jgi:bifunctional ADP-heptose synthase (sugar kinase/adenylyltransferase)
MRSLQTTVKLRVIGRQQQLLRLDFESDAQKRSAGLADRGFARLTPAHDAVLFSDYGKGGLAHIATMISAARAAGKPVLVDPKGRTIHAMPAPPSSHPTGPSCSRSLGSVARVRPRCATRRRPCANQLSLGAVLLTRSEEGMTCLMRRANCTSRPRRAKCLTSPVPVTR